MQQMTASVELIKFRSAGGWNATKLPTTYRVAWQAITNTRKPRRKANINSGSNSEPLSVGETSKEELESQSDHNRLRLTSRLLTTTTLAASRREVEVSP